MILVTGHCGPSRTPGLLCHGCSLIGALHLASSSLGLSGQCGANAGSANGSIIWSKAHETVNLTSVPLRARVCTTSRRARGCRQASQFEQLAGLDSEGARELADAGHADILAAFAAGDGVARDARSPGEIGLGECPLQS